MVDYPNVPNLPGVPPVYRDPNATTPTVDYATQDTASTADTTTDRWGLFTVGGAVALEVDSVVEVDFSKDYNTPQYPIELGSFESYNKVEMPYDATLVVSKGGLTTDRAQFQDTLESLLASLDLFDLVTPEKTYQNANLVGLRITRNAQRGAGLIVAEIKLRQIRIGEAAAFSNTKSDNASDQADTGAVQGQTPSTGTTTAASGPNTIGH